MFVWTAAIALLAFYAFCVPVKFALVVRLHARTAFGAGASVFEGCYAIKSADRRACAETKRPPRKRPAPKLDKSAALPAAWESGKYLVKHLKIEKLHAQGHVSAPDAAQTAMICGCARTLEGMLLPFLPLNAIHLRLQPDFSAPHSDASLCGMISVPAGHIMLAALIGAWNYLSRRISNGKTSH